MYREDDDRGQSAVLVAIAMLVVVIFAAITVDVSSAYLGRRTAQNAADGAALAAARQLMLQYNRGVYNDTAIKIELNDFGERNGAEDTGGVLADAENSSVTGIYLDENENSIGVIGLGSVPPDTYGVEATVYMTTPAFFGGIMGRSGYPIQAQAAVVLDMACGVGCVVPIATHMWAFTTTAECYNIYNGSGPGNFGWLNWELQGIPCTTGQGCTSTPELEANLDPDTCRSGFIEFGEYVAGTPSDRNPNLLRPLLMEYIDDQIEFTVIVWDTTAELGGANQAYRVAGFARMQLTGYQLSQGASSNVITYGDLGTTCETIGTDPNNGVRLTAEFLGWAGGEGGNCRAIGTVRAPSLKR
ncbi:MAG TPA: pilus assembly protein TadG-related protein [Anaerolineae bacterium]|nr:pilus assembly protein TadG-related protein [Anaerolineae bacterium]